MPLPLVPALLGGLAAAAGSLTGRVLLAAGIGYVTFSGTTIAINGVIDGIKTNMAGLGADAVQFLAFMWVDRAMAMVFSAWVAAMAIKTAGSDAIKKMVVK